MKYKEIKQKICNIVKKDKEVIAILLYGSYARKENYRDIDICLVLDKKYPNLYMSKKRLYYLKKLPNIIDLQIFQQLPVYIRIRILKEDKIVLSKNTERLYEIAFETLKEFNSYEKLYNMYLGNVENG